MRTSCDIDVFVREADLDRAMEALSENLSYRIGEISDHDVQIYTPNAQHIELHRNLIEDHRINQAAEVLAAVWDTAIPHSGWTYWLEMPDELFYFYHIAHKEAQREGTPRRHEGRRGNYGARSLPRHEAAVKE